MDASGAPVTDELTGVHHSPQRDAIYEPEKTARRKAHAAAGLLDAKTHHVHLHNFTQHSTTVCRQRPGCSLLKASLLDPRSLFIILPTLIHFLLHNIIIKST